MRWEGDLSSHVPRQFRSVAARLGPTPQPSSFSVDGLNALLTTQDRYVEAVVYGVGAKPEGGVSRVNAAAALCWAIPCRDTRDLGG